MEQIDLTIAKQMVERYHSSRKELIDSTLKIDDTKSIWFDIAAFKSFVEKLPAETTGVRVYLAAYDEKQPLAPHQTTVVLIGTVDQGGDDVDAILDSSNLTAGLAPVNIGKNCPPICP